MLKLLTFVVLYITFVYSNSEHNVDTQLPKNELQLPIKQADDIKNTFETVKGHYIEEKKKTKPCQKNKNRRLSDDDVFESLPVTSTIEQINTANVGSKFITATLHGANYNYKNEKTSTDSETDSTNSNAKNCDCNDCLLEANKKEIQFESLALDNSNIPFNDAAIDSKTGESESVDRDNNPINSDTLDINTDKSTSVDRNSNPLENGELKINNSSEHTTLCNRGRSLYTRRRKCGKVDHSQDLPTTPTTRRIIPGIIDSPTAQEQKDYKLYQDTTKSERSFEAENRQSYFPNVHKISNSYDIDLVHNMNINDAPDISPPAEDSIESQLIEPTRGKGIYDMKDTGVMLLENSRVCYACSTISDPTCWTPDRRTTVKYCRKGHQSCLTKSFKHRGKSVIIRDCGSQCVSFNGEENYSSCSICHSDVCNGASTVNLINISVAIITLFGILFTTH